ncbi:conjugal transfer transcriptional regulator TraJ [Pandoraea apista]|uniref:conjugal transfer transcriptional regulator TraJ n=1 Tax=Pandoraea apista TaxID=93218 RepID=UPI000659DADF|nr:conjugal transfer transcriptional regulator TraJ [Pandoraea apista]ALS68391.1 conjugal transfer protein TraJ [Pandoraea apista]CFB60485.1 hypothetical protein LMG16407_00524 [Pandoraea apista]
MNVELTPDRKRVRGSRRKKHLRVPVFPDEDARIEASAGKAGLPVATYLRNVGLGYDVRGVADLKHIKQLAKINADQGRLGGLLKLWLTNDERVAGFGVGSINALLGKLGETQEQLREVMRHVLKG